MSLDQYTHGCEYYVSISQSKLRLMARLMAMDLAIGTASKLPHLLKFLEIVFNSLPHQHKRNMRSPSSYSHSCLLRSNSIQQHPTYTVLKDSHKVLEAVVS